MKKSVLNLELKNRRKSTASWASSEHVMVDVFLDNVKISEYSWHPRDEIEKPSVYDVESCLVADAMCVSDGKSFEEFCQEFGYDIWGEDRAEIYKVYNLCLDTYWTLVRTGSWERLKSVHEND